MSGWAQRERADLVVLLRERGPDAPVVPEGWRTQHLAAHLYVRERRPDAAPGVVLGGPVAAYTDRVMASVLRVHGYDDIVNSVAAGPPLYLRPVDEYINLNEFFVHHEDVRRAAGDGPRELPPELEQLLWNRLRRAARMLFRRVKGVEVQLVNPAGERARAGSGERVVLSGTAGELTLFAFNRKHVAAVDMTGDAAALDRLRAASLGP